MNPRPAPVTFLPLTPALRARIETTIEQLVALLDAVDGDADAEPWLGWTYRFDGVPVSPAADGGDDRELEDEHDEDGGDDEVSDTEAEGFGLAYRGDGAEIAHAMLRRAWRQRAARVVGR
jgi:hypothetical protein